MSEPHKNKKGVGVGFGWIHRIDGGGTSRLKNSFFIVALLQIDFYDDIL